MQNLTESVAPRQWTVEQEAVCSSTGSAVLVSAYAGCGKTSVLIEYARRRPHEKMIYLAFNRAIKAEAESRFPSNVRCVTTHGLAYAKHGRLYSHKLGNPKPYLLQAEFKYPLEVASSVLDIINAFLASADAEIGQAHILAAGLSLIDEKEGTKAANRVWAAMCDVNNTSCVMPHDGYVKLFQLSNPTIKYDVILFDEAQDAAPAIYHIVRNQKCRKVIVGDKYQSIYGWRGAVNAMDDFATIADEKLNLTASFRFGAGIAEMASTILRNARGEPLPLRGFGKVPTKWTVDPKLAHTVIARTNAGLFDAAAQLVRSKRKFGFVGGVNSYKFDLILDAYKLSVGQNKSIKNKFMQSFKDWAAFNTYANDLDDWECKALKQIVKSYGYDIPGLIDSIKRDSIEESEKPAVLLVTAHKAKGLEFDQVILLDDFSTLEARFNKTTKQVIQPSEGEINLVYVAATRAIRAIQVNPSLGIWLNKMPTVRQSQQAPELAPIETVAPVVQAPVPPKKTRKPRKQTAVLPAQNFDLASVQNTINTIRGALSKSLEPTGLSQVDIALLCQASAAAADMLQQLGSARR